MDILLFGQAFVGRRSRKFRFMRVRIEITMPLPSVLFGFLVSTLYGAVFHLWRGGGAGRLLLYLISGWLGFWAGHLLAAQIGWTFFSLGVLHLGLATVTSIVFIFVGHWLSLVDVGTKK